LKASDLFVKCLENEGVRYIFGVPGEENEDLLFSLEGSSIKFIPTRHEQGAAFMANVWGRITGQAGVCLSTLGPGATNLITGVADANLDKAPLVAITGQTAARAHHHESHQHLNIVGIFSHITKWNTAVLDPQTIPEIVRKAFKTAESEKPGATHIELSEQMAKEMVENQSPLNVQRVRRPDPDQQALDEAVSLLSGSRRPLILAGNGAVRKPASAGLRELINHCHIPIVHTFMGQGAVSENSDESLQTIGLGFRDYVMDAVDQADLIITIGYDIAEYAPAKWNPKKDKKIIHIDFTQAEVYSHYQPAVEIVADIPATLRELNEKLKNKSCKFDSSWYAPIRDKIRQDIKSYDLKEGERFTVPGVLNILREIMDDDDLLISDVGSHKMWIARNFPTHSPNGCIISNGLASMGISLPGAIAAALEDPKRHIVAAMGDGGFLMNSQELETAKRLKLGFTVIVFNDNDYGLIRWKQEMSQGKNFGTTITNPDFKAYAESFGIKGYKPKTVPELKEQLKQAVHSKELCLMEIPISTHVNVELINKTRKGAKE
jgi:acetolactate synthase I/II/III large subunit